MFGFFRTIHIKLDEIIRRSDKMATTLTQLDAAIASLSTEVSTVVADVTALINKINSSPAAPDFTAELNSVQASLSALQGSDAAAQAVLNPPAAPAS